MPIRLRLALLFAVATAVATVIGGVLFVNTLSTGLRNSVLASLEVRASAIAQQLPDPGGQAGGQGRSGVQDPGSLPASAGGVDVQELTQVIGPTGRIVDASGPGTSASLLTAAQRAQARRQSLVVQRTVASQPDPFVLLASPSGGQSVLVVGVSLATVDQAVDRVMAEIMVGGIVGVVVAGFGAWLLAGAALRPVERMRRQAAELSEHDTDAALAVPPSRDEIASLARTLNGLLGRLHGALHRQRGFVSAAGHELRSPLAILNGELELGRRPGRTKAEMADALAAAAVETDRIIHLTDDLLLLSRGDEQALGLHRTPNDLVELVATSVEAFGLRAERDRIRLETVGPADLVVKVDAQRYRQIVDNLIDNSLRYSPPGSTLRIAVQRSGDTAVLEVFDQGPGFPEEFLPHAFERFSRPDASRTRDGGGTGLGLAIVRSLAEAHGGTAMASNGTHGGAVVTVVIPAEPGLLPVFFDLHRAPDIGDPDGQQTDGDGENGPEVDGVVDQGADSGH
jgi:two-component system OmpR family sensor kinase